ncbi:unnamed protein product [Larinioides sclopetarius]|uniref:Uncharacterized protein n=1 Tax=Larinioides sclopetarius TaxID=280406 RepID=A0AAV1ZU67_9ARAC
MYHPMKMLFKYQSSLYQESLVEQQQKENLVLQILVLLDQEMSCIKQLICHALQNQIQKEILFSQT